MKPLFVIQYWKREPKSSQAPAITFEICHTEEELIAFLRKVYGNYTIYKVGGEYESKTHFDKIFKQEKEEVEKQEYLKLKAKYDND